MPLPEDWRAFIESLNSNGVEYLEVGAVALAHPGLPRYTGDLDVLVRNSPENAKRLESALAEFGFAGLDGGGIGYGITRSSYVDRNSGFHFHRTVGNRTDAIGRGSACGCRQRAGG